MLAIYHSEWKHQHQINLGGQSAFLPSSAKKMKKLRFQKFQANMVCVFSLFYYFQDNVQLFPLCTL